MERRINWRGGGSKGEKDSKGGGEKEWESDIKHQGANWANPPAHSFFYVVSLSPFSPFYPPYFLPFPSVSLSHLLLLSPPTPLISFKSSYISRSTHLPPLPHSLSPLAPKNQVDLNEQMKRGGKWLLRGSPEKAGSALSGSVFVYSGLPHVKLSVSFCHFFRGKTIRHLDNLEVCNLSLFF